MQSINVSVTVIKAIIIQRDRVTAELLEWRRALIIGSCVCVLWLQKNLDGQREIVGGRQ